jgi:hypothetical protein
VARLNAVRLAHAPNVQERLTKTKSKVTILETSSPGCTGAVLSRNRGLVQIGGMGLRVSSIGGGDLAPCGQEPEKPELAKKERYTTPQRPAPTLGGHKSKIPPPIDVTRLPRGRIEVGSEHYKRMGERNWYLAGKYDPKRWYHQAWNLVTGAMSNPKNLLTAAERTEHEALSAKIVQSVTTSAYTVDPKVAAMENNPLGTTAAVIAGVLGAGENTQTAFFALGALGDASALGPAIKAKGTTGPGVSAMRRSRSTGGAPGRGFQTAQKRGPKPRFPNGRRIEDPGPGGVLLTKIEADFIAKNIIKYARYFRLELILVKEGEGQYRLTSGYNAGYSGQLNPPGLIIRAYRYERSVDDWEVYYPGMQFPW